MNGIRLYTSNHLEALAEELAGALRVPLSSPLAEEIIVVQSSGMERWVSMQLAEHLGICANCRFPFPNAFVYEVFRKVLQDLPDSSPFDPGIMTWKIMQLLPAHADQPGFESLSNYLGEDPEGLKCFQVAERIAHLFDQYLLFRPEMVLDWQHGKEDHWQAVLWRALAKGRENQHHPALAKSFLEMVQESPFHISGLPERISVFGISALPRFHLQVISGIAQVTRVNLFLMNPCQEYWGDIASERQIRKTISAGVALPEQVYLQRGNSLLASMGTLGRDFWDMINEFDCQATERFQQPTERDLLACIQSDILNLRERDEKAEARQPISPKDASIQVHSCHSPMREMEILYDRLLDMFENDPTLMPRDVLVMTPDIEAYAPYIEAVFAAHPDDARKIPFSIADRSMRRESQVVDAFLAVLDLSGGRFRASEVLAVLASRAVQRRFGLAEADLQLVRRWVKGVRIRWGIDRQSRKQLGLPAFAENTWKAGLDRLLLGYAMPFENHQTFSGILPYDLIEGSEALVLGRLAEFTEKLFRQMTSLGRPRMLQDWSGVLTELVEKLFAPDEAGRNELQAIRLTLKELSELGDLSGFAGEVDVKVIKSYLRHRLERESFGFGFITGGVTFCAMLPMRSIPNKVICLVGMNNDAYPRQSKTLGFDLMAKDPRKGDRSRRNDDRYLFLEAILSARQSLYISYVGQSIQDNSSIPPSVLVSELTDYVERGFSVTGDDIADHLLTRHRLQAFSPEYFKDSGGKLFSYSEDNCRAAGQISKDRELPPAFISEGLAGPEEQLKVLDLSDLCAFFGNPAKYLLNKRLGIYFEQQVQAPEQSELFEIKQLEKYMLERDLIELRLDGHDLKGLFFAKKAEGMLPHGTPGECSYEALARGVEKFVERTEPYLKDRIPEPIDLELKIADFTLVGRIAAVYSGSLVHYRYARLKPVDHLRLWIHHLALGAAFPNTDFYSSLIGLPADRKDEWTSFQYPSVGSAADLLEELLNIYWQGLVRPVHFFPKSSWRYAAELLQKSGSLETSLKKSVNEWRGSDFSAGESRDPYYEICFRYREPIDEEFQSLAEEVFGPLFEHQTEIQSPLPKSQETQ